MSLFSLGRRRARTTHEHLDRMQDKLSQHVDSARERLQNASGQLKTQASDYTRQAGKTVTQLGRCARQSPWTYAVGGLALGLAAGLLLGRSHRD